MAFRARWGELRKSGWTSKKPTGLSDDFTYLQPGKTTKGVRGVDYFVGANELMLYLDKVDLEELRTQKLAADKAEKRNEKLVPRPKAAAKAAVRPKASAKATRRDINSSTRKKPVAAAKTTQRQKKSGDEALPVPASVPQTPVLPSTRVISGVIPCDSTNSAKSDAYSSPGSAPPTSPVTSRNLDRDFVLADISDSSSDSILDDNLLDDCNSAVGASTEEEAKVAPPRANNEDVNTSSGFMNYATFESDAENDDGEDNDSFEDCNDLNDEHLPVPQMRFDDELVSSIGGMTNIASGQASDRFLKEMRETGWGELTTHTPYDYLMQPYEPRLPQAMINDYPNLYNGVSGPTARALAAAATPSGAFFYFLQPELWEDIATETNNYFESKIDERVKGQYLKQVAREQKYPNFKRKTRETIREDLLRVSSVTPRELCVFVGLLLARCVATNKEKLANHWRTTDEGAIPRGCFGEFMTRDRFMHLSRNLHFSPNDDERAATDRA